MPTDTHFALKLRETLGSESAGKWLEFMDQVKQSLPFLLGNSGRPPKDQIDHSVIGRAGFRSWKEMIETSPTRGGLGWSYDSWKAWKKAYAIVLDHPYLRSIDPALSASEINTVNRDCNEFPPDPDALQAYRSRRKNQGEERRQNSVSSLQQQLQAAQQELAALHSHLAASRASEDNLKAINAQIMDQLNLAQKNVGELESKLKKALYDVDQLKAGSDKKELKINDLEKELKGLKKTIRSYESKGFWAFLRLAFSALKP